MLIIYHSITNKLFPSLQHPLFSRKLLATAIAVEYVTESRTWQTAVDHIQSSPIRKLVLCLNSQIKFQRLSVKSLNIKHTIHREDAIATTRNFDYFFTGNIANAFGYAISVVVMPNTSLSISAPAARPNRSFVVDENPSLQNEIVVKVNQ